MPPRELPFIDNRLSPGPAGRSVPVRGGTIRSSGPLLRRVQSRPAVLPARPGTAVLHELPPEPPLDAQVAARHVVIERRSDLHDRVVLDAKLQRAADAAVGADGVGLGLLRLVPGAGTAHVVLGLEHQRAGGADADAVAAVDAG